MDKFPLVLFSGALGAICVMGVLGVAAIDEYQKEQFIPDFETMDCKELSKWILDKRINGNGYEKTAASIQADIYPIKCQELIRGD